MRLEWETRKPGRCLTSPGRDRNRWRVPMSTHATCSVDGCDRPTNKRGWCNMHYQRWRRLGDPVDLTLRHPEQMRPSVDHVIPRARGGSDEPHNLQLAHLWCNQVKHDRIGPMSGGEGVRIRCGC